MKYMKSIILFVGVIFSCKSVSTDNIVLVNLDKISKYALQEKHTSVILIKSFILEKECFVSKEVYANVFLCKTVLESDTILVFSICKPPYSFLKESYNGIRELVIDSSTELSRYHSRLSVNINKDLLTKGYKYVVADINNLEY